jgi:ABC-type nickel/cobalt efflux system permease component RcnA
MEILSFSLGIAFVVVAATAVVAVYAFVKVNQVKKYLENTERYFSHEISNVYKEIAGRADEITRSMDSRLDKLENKLTNNK